MANTNIGISNFINSQAPFFARNDHPNFIRFVEAYYEYMEQEGKTIERAKGFRDALDVDKSIDLYTEQLYSQFMNMIPTDVIADKNLIIKHIKDFYRARGTEKSIEFLMAILFDEAVTFYYPKRDILKASDGKWYQEKSLKIYDILVNNVADPSIFTAKNFTGRQIRGETSNATATVESVDVYYETGVIVKELKISNQVRDFKAGELIRSTYEEEGLIKDIAANVFSGIIVRADIINRGNNYAVGQRANVISNTGSGAILSISEVSAAAIKSISPIDGGAGFQNGNSILISSAGGFGANANVSLVSADGTYHPNNYNIVITLISHMANAVIGTVDNNPYETFSYANLDYILATLPGNTSNLTANSNPGVSINTLRFNHWIANSNVFIKTGDSINAYNTQTATSYVLKITISNSTSNQVTFTPLMPGSVGLNRIEIIPEPFNAKSNLTISCGVGAAVTTINLSAWKANSNVFFESFDNVYIANVAAGYYANTTIISSNSRTNQLIVSPGLPGPLTNQEFFVLKRPSRSTTLANSLGFFAYSNTGPIQRVLVLAGGQGYTGAVSLTAQANTRITNLGIIGRLAIVNRGYGYAVNDEIEILNKQWATYSAGAGGRAYVSSVNAYGSITGVRLKEVPGFPIGGTGYSEEDLPTANIISATGVGGNVAVTGLLGGGEILTSTSDDIGAILKIDILSGGTGYATAPAIDLTNYGSGTAQVNVTIVQGVYTYPGRYLNDDGHLSSFNFLQDGTYYHNYSYVTRIRKSIEKYRDALKNLAHPAGMSLFGEHISVDEGTTMNVQLVAANTTKKIVFNYAPYRANSGNIRITKTNHGIKSGNNVYLEFQSGNTINIMNGIFSVKTSNANTFFVLQANTVNTSGNVYYGIIQ